MTNSVNPYTSQSISLYNDSPPPDDGTTGANNLVTWAKHKTKLADPIKTHASDIDSATLAAFAKTVNADAAVRSRIDGSLGFGWATETIADNIITPDSTAVTLVPESIGSDVLFEIKADSVYDGAQLILKPKTATQVITLLHATATESATATAANIYTSNNGNIVLRGEEASMTLMYDAAVATGWVEKSRSNTVSSYPRNHIAGLTLTRPGVQSLGIAIGEARCKDNLVNVALTSAYTKDVSSAWTVGTGNGSLDTGVIAVNSTYAVYAIFSALTGLTDILTSVSFTAPTLPSGYTRSRLIGAFTTDASPNIIDFLQVGDYFRYTGDVVQDLYDAGHIAGTWETTDVSAAPYSVAHGYAHLTMDSTGNDNSYVGIRYPGAADASALESISSINVSGIAMHGVGGEFHCLTDSLRRVEYDHKPQAAGNNDFYIRTFGFTMLTRSNPV